MYSITYTDWRPAIRIGFENNKHYIIMDNGIIGFATWGGDVTVAFTA